MVLYVLEGGDSEEQYHLEAAYTRGEDIEELVADTPVSLKTFDAGEADRFQDYVRDRCDMYDVPMTDAVEFFEDYREYINHPDTMVARIEKELQ